MKWRIVGVILALEAIFALTLFTWAATDPPAPNPQPAPVVMPSRDAIPLSVSMPWMQQVDVDHSVRLVRIRGVSQDVPATCYLWFESPHGLVVHALPSC